MSKISNNNIDKIDHAESGATRGAVIDHLKRGGPQSAATLAKALGVTPMGVRLHLYALEDEGLVSSVSEAKGRGRPTKNWLLTDEAARIFPDAHQGLAVEMINSVRELFGDEGLEKLVHNHGKKQRATYGKTLSAAKTIGDRVKRLAKARSDEGYMAEVKKDGHDWLLIENHCPICSAAKACKGLCANELKVFSDVLGDDVKITREEHILSGGRRCTYRVKEQ